MRKPLAVTMIIVLLLSSLPVMPPASVRSALAHAPTLPEPPTPPVTPPLPAEPGAEGEAMPTPPPPGNLPPEMEKERARQAIEAVLEKYLNYWGPRYQAAPVEVAVEGEWAHGAAEWRGTASTVDGPLHVLARRDESGAWQALMPSEEGLYLQWVEEMPERLVPTRERNLLRTQAVKADALRKPQIIPAVPPAETVMPPSDKDLAKPGEDDSATDPIPTVGTGSWLKYIDDMYGFSISVPTSWNVHPATADRMGSVTQFTSLDKNLEEFDEQDHTKIEIGIFNRDRPIDVKIDEWAKPDPSVAHEMTSQHHTIVAGRDALRQNFDNGIQSGAIFMVPNHTKVYFIAIMPLDSLQSSDVARVLQSLQIIQPYNRIQPQSTRLYPTTTDDLNVSIQAPSGYRLPFVGWHTISNGPGCSSTHTGRSSEAIDFGQMSVGTPIYTTQTGDIVYATYGWNDGFGNLMKIRHDDGNTSWYAHLDSFVNTGGRVNWEDHIANSGDTGNSTGPHLHFEVRNSNNYSIWIRDMPGITWYSGDPSKPCQPVGYNDGEADGPPLGGSGTCSVPFLNSPNDGYVHISSDRTITFNWSPPSDCSPDGYTFRVKTVPDMDSGGATIFDEGQGDTQVTKSFGSEWDNTDLYWSVRACKPCTPYNPGPWAPARRFRIEPGSSPPATGTWNARYDQGSTLWWDPDATITPRCTEDVGGPELHKDWGSNAPCGGMNGDDWVGDFNATINFPAGEYVFHLNHDDGVKLWLNGQNIQDRGGSGSGPVCNGSGGYNLDGDEDLRVLLREEGGDAHVHLTWSTDTSVCNPPPDPPVPQSPGNGSTFDEGESISLSWSDTGDEYYGEVWGGPGGTLTFGWQSGTSYNLGSQWAGYTYSWHVKARNDAGESGWSDTWTFTVKPAAPSNLSAQTASCSEVNLYWDDNSGNEEGYKIYRDGSYVGQVGANTTSYQDTGLGENTSYSYHVKAFRGSIESDASNTVNVTTPSCAPPQPDLMPSQWGGWQYPVVPSSVTNTVVVNTLYAGYPTYIDWGLTNYGDADTGGNTYGALYIDDVRIGYHDFGDVQAGWTWAFFDQVEVVDTPGWHTLKSVADPDDLIDESDETNNVFERDFYWTPSAPYTDDMENGTGDWIATGLWRQVDENTSPYPESHSWSHSWWYGQDGTGDYDTGAANSGDLTSPPIYVPDSGYYLRFWYWYETETQGSYWDQRWVQISVNGGSFNDVLQLYDDPQEWWLQSPVIDLSSYAGHTIRVRFRFDTIDDSFNDYGGWYIDDFEISDTPPPSCDDAHEPNDTASQATSIAYGQTLDADICPGGDYDFYQFTGSAGDKVVVDVDAEVDGSLLDSYIYLLDSDGTYVLAQNDDEILADVHDSHLGYQLPYTGTYYIKVKAWDHPSAGSTDHFYTIHLLADDANPTSAEITSPTNDDWLDPALETISVSTTDDESGINRVEFLWHDADWENSDWAWLGADQDSRDGWEFDWDTDVITEQHGIAIYIWAFDWGGNWTGAGVWNVGIDRTPPSVTTDAYPTYGDAPFRDFWVNWWDSWDNLSGIASYDVQYRDGAAGTWADLAVGTTDVYTHFVGLDGHTYYFRARARDNAGNHSAYAGGDGDAQYTVDVCDTAPDAYESDNAAGSARWIDTDGTAQTRNIHAEGDEDWVKFYAAAGVTYTLATSNTGGHADTVLDLYGKDGSTLIDSNDDYPGMWPASRLDWQPSASGTYYAKVYHYDSWAYGCTTGYELTILTNDETPPSGSVSINSGATYAASTATTLALAGTDTGTGVWQVTASNNSDFAGATWTDDTPLLDWTLMAGDGTKTVYVKFRDRAGNVSGVYSDDIVLDTTAPTGSILIQGGAAVVTQTQVALTLAASDAHGVTHIRLRNGTAAWSAWEPFAESRTWTLPVQEGERVVYVQFRDPAGNVSATYSDPIVYQFPQSVYLPLIARDE